MSLESIVKSLSLENVMKNLYGMCNQSLLVLVISVIAIVNCIWNSKMALAFVLVINAILSVMVLNCLCKADCSNLAWLYAVVSSISILSTGRILFD